jgi:hypothetical protein
MPVAVAIQVTEPDADDRRVDALATQLRRELLELDVDEVAKPSAGDAPPGTRAIELAAVGALIVTMQQSADLLVGVVSAIREWLKRDPAALRTVKVTVGDRTIELTAASAEQQERLVAEFVRSMEQPRPEPQQAASGEQR